MTTLVIRRHQPLFIAHHTGASLGPRHSTIDRFIQKLIGDFGGVLSRGQQCGFVQHVGQICTGEAGGFAGQNCQVNALSHGLTLGVYFQNFLAALHVGGIHLNLAVKSSRAQQRRVQNVGAVCRRNENHVGLGVKTIHFDKELIQGLFTLIVAAPHAGTTVSTDSVDFIDKDDGRSVLFGLGEKVSNAGGPHTDKHFDEIRAGD